MARESGTRPKKPTAKALAQQEQDLARSLSSAKKAASKKRATSGEKNDPPATTSATTSAPSSSPISASTLVRHMSTGALPVVTTPENSNGAPAATVSGARQDLSPAGPVMDPKDVSELASLRVELAVMKRELKEAQEAATGRCHTGEALIKRPAKIGNLREAMGLKYKEQKYRNFRNNVRYYAAVVAIDPSTPWPRQDINKIARICDLMKKKHWYLKPFVGDWAIKECLREHLSNKRGYQRRNNHQDEDNDASEFGSVREGSDEDNEDGEGNEDDGSNGGDSSIGGDEDNDA